ncbi:MAG: ABC transporter ATP-binding protein [Sphingobacteriia bacterium]|nr:ABC transporter ATP-binding protein [Sphingobacteriia bacterium]
MQNQKSAKIALTNVDVTGIDCFARSFFIKHIFLNPFKFKNKKDKVKIPILKNINLEINHGEKVGFLGFNGSGKSSLLKAIAGIYPQESGKIDVYGTISAIIDMGLGFDGELTGRENIKLGLLYFNRITEYSKELEEQVIEFSELGEKIDVPIKYYSSGMISRLAFSISTSTESDILLLDEVFAAGDAKFVQKSSDYMKQKFQKSSISIMVSHAENIIRENCTRCVLLQNGEIIADGATDDVFKEYNKVKI